MRIPVIFICVSFFVSCAEFGAFEEQGLDAKTEKQIVKDCVKYVNKKENTITYTINNTKIIKYFGVYNECIIVKLSFKNSFMVYADEYNSYYFDDIIILGTTGSPIMVWREGNVYSLPEAWKYEILKYDDIFLLVESYPEITRYY